MFMDLVGIPAAVLILNTLSIWIFPCYWAVTGRLHQNHAKSGKKRIVELKLNYPFFVGC